MFTQWSTTIMRWTCQTAPAAIHGPSPTVLDDSTAATRREVKRR